MAHSKEGDKSIPIAWGFPDQNRSFSNGDIEVARGMNMYAINKFTMNRIESTGESAGRREATFLK
jgi:hypothetical protein